MLEVPGFVSITYLTTGKHPILLPPRLGAIMESWPIDHSPGS